MESSIMIVADEIFMVVWNGGIRQSTVRFWQEKAFGCLFEEREGERTDDFGGLYSFVKLGVLRSIEVHISLCGEV